MYAPLARAFDILSLLANARNGETVSTVSAELGIAKSAAHRLLTTLVEEGFAAQDQVSERYHLTLKLPVLGFRLLATLGVTDVVQPVLDRLAQASGELVRLGLVEDEEIHWVAWSQGSSDSLRYVPDFGRRIVLHTTGAGTVWLASMPDAEALRIYRKQKAAETSRSRLTEKELLAKLAQIRRDGYGLNLELAERGINAMAVTIESNGPKGPVVVGTLSIAGPSIRLTEARLSKLLPILKAHAVELGSVWPMHLQIAAPR